MPERPNVLWICTDQQRADTLGSYGNDYVATPAVDRLAEQGVQFDRAYAQSPVCAPSRASFLTGRYPRTCGVVGNGHELPEEETLVPRQFADAGYVCGLAGKLHVSPAHPDSSTLPMGERRGDDGYAEFRWSHDATHPSPANEYQTWLASQDVAYEEEPVAGTEYVTVGPPAEHHQTTWCADRANAFVERAADSDRPWLYSVNPFDPHHAFVAPEDYLDRYRERLADIPLPAYEPGELDDKPPWYRKCHEGAYQNPDLFPYTEMDERDHRLIRAAYWAMCDLIDDAVGSMLETLERTGQRENTIVVFTSDHGELLGDHGIYLKGPMFYEEALRVPLVVDWPGPVRSDHRTDALVELVDLAPTLLEAAGVDVPRAMQGESFLDVLTGEVDRHRESVYAEAYDAVGWQEPSDRSTMIRTDSYKLVRHHGVGTGELYDLRADPRETNDRWDDPAYASVRTDLLLELSDRMAGTTDPRPEREVPW